MDTYKHVVIAVDLHPSCDKVVITKAIKIAKASNAKISIVHAVEHINAYGVAEAYSAVVDVEAQLIEDARKELTKIGQDFGVSADSLYLEVGAPKTVVLDKVEELNADLIVVGSHGRHGLQLLLGSTANAILHHAKCDVFAVRVEEND
jgi:universal stress protein A